MCIRDRFLEYKNLRPPRSWNTRTLPSSLFLEYKNLAVLLVLGIQDPCRPPNSWNTRTLPSSLFLEYKSLSVLEADLGPCFDFRKPSPPPGLSANAWPAKRFDRRPGGRRNPCAKPLGYRAVARIAARGLWCCSTKKHTKKEVPNREVCKTVLIFGYKG